MRAISDLSNRYLEEVIEALPEAIALFDDEGRFVFWNTRFATIYGADVELRIGIRFQDHLRQTVARGLVPAAEGREEEWLAERLHRFDTGVGSHVHRLGNGRWMRVQDRLLPGGGRIGIRTDVTDLVEREQTFRLFYEANPTPMLVVDRHTFDLLSANDAAVAFYGYPREALLGLKLGDLRPENYPGEIAAAMTALEQEPAQATRSIHRTASGASRSVEINARLLHFNGRIAMLGAVFDITEQQRMEEEVRRTRAFLKQVVDQVPVAVFAKDMDDGGRYVLYNRATETIFGLPPGGALGRRAEELYDPAFVAEITAQDAAALRFGSFVAPHDDAVRHADGSTRLIRTRVVSLPDAASNQPRFVLGVSEDVTEQRASAARIAHMAHHDLLTNLPNRMLFQERLGEALSRLQANGASLALLYLDLDGFKAVNDAWGHAAGDGLLRAVSDRLRTLLRDGDTAARFGGDEFALIHMPLRRPRDVERLARQVVDIMSRPFVIAGRELHVSASVGVALAPAHGLDADLLLARADAAMYRAKREGRRTFRLVA